ncbi:MAG TPA: UTP--glucose-1-phosphate uridylyltransferase, partial [Candidatus Hydrogenedentes bacterium]|nr:UTP--glucose-1-phosphate uridylyltransferase [Candidatus Hydrogenedentota bacterium]
LAFQTLADQVRRSVRASEGNRWMFRVGHAEDHPVRFRPEMLDHGDGAPFYPVLLEQTPVRLDLSHSGWSDIFFLGMDFPEGARVLNISVNLGVYGRDRDVKPPVETYVRVIPEPVLRLTSVDLEATKDITTLEDLFNFGNDYLGLLKAGVIASGLVPPSFEGTDQRIADILGRVVEPGMGVELVTRVNDIPKGSRLAVSTTLLASIVSALMRATGQTEAVEGALSERERRLVASRAILGEWLGGSGGGWQDSGGVWPGLKVIQGALAAESDPEWGV